MKSSSRKKLLLLILSLLFLIGTIIFIFYIHFRGAPEYTEDIAKLLPQDTIIYLSVVDLAGLINEISELKICEELNKSEDFAAFLLKSDEWKKIKKQKSKFEKATKIRLTREFFEKWFGQHLVVALMNIPEQKTPGIVFVSRTKMGFEEKLAEFVAQIFPELFLQTSSYRGVTLNLYDAPKSTRSFSFMRFGRTVVLSIRSRNLDYLKRIIDQKELKNNNECLADNPEFKSAFEGMESNRGLVLFFHPDRLFSAIFNFQSEKKQKAKESEISKSLKLLFKPYDFGCLKIALELRGLDVSGKFHYSNDIASSKKNDFINRVSQQKSGGKDSFSLVVFRKKISKQLHYDSLITLRAYGKNSLNAIQSIIDSLKEMHNFSKIYEALVSQISSAFNIDVKKTIPAVIGDGIAISFRSVVPTPLFPVVSAGIFFEISDLNKVKRIITSIKKGVVIEGKQVVPDVEKNYENEILTINTPLYPISLSQTNDILVIALDKNFVKEAIELTVKNEKSIKDNPVYKKIQIKEIREPEFDFFINFEKASDVFYLASKQMFGWDKKSRTRIEEFRKYSAILKYLHGLRLISYIADDTRNIEMLIPINEK